MLTEKQRRKKIYALTRDNKSWYQSFFQFCIQESNPWFGEFGLDYEPTQKNFKDFLNIVTINPPATQNLSPKQVSMPFDAFQKMRERNYGFWSFWHEYLCSENIGTIKIAPDVTFVPCGFPGFFPKKLFNITRGMEIKWSSDMSD